MHIWKKWMVCFGMILCIPALSACSSKESGAREEQTVEEQSSEEGTTKEENAEEETADEEKTEEQAAQKDGAAQTYAGAAEAPLPIGEFGYLKSSTDIFGEYEIELRVNKVLRGKEAQKQEYELNKNDVEFRKMQPGQEYIMVHITANLLSADLINREMLRIDSEDFDFLDSETGEGYYYTDMVFLSPHDLTGIVPGGTASGWIGGIIDSGDKDPILYYRALGYEMLYFRLDPAYDIPDGYSSYQPRLVITENPIRDAKEEKGSWKNPYAMGETVELNYDPKVEEELLASPFTGSIRVTEAYRGKQAEKFVLPGVVGLYDDKPDYELIVVKVEVNVEEVDGIYIPFFDAGAYVILNGQGRMMQHEAMYDDDLKMDGIEEVKPGSRKEGYAAFYVPKGNDNFVISYGNPDGDLAPAAWISLQFADSAPKV